MKKFIVAFGIIFLAGCQIPTGMEKDSPPPPPPLSFEETSSIPPIEETSSIPPIEESSDDPEIVLSVEEILDPIEESSLPPIAE